MIPHLRELMLFLVAAGIVVPLLSRLRLNPVLGYLLTGFLIGPHGLGLLAGDERWLAVLTISDLDGVRQLAELGVVFLLFVIGLELSVERLWKLRRWVFGLGSAQVLASALLLGLLALALGVNSGAATLIGASFALSSTAIVMQLLALKRQLGTPLGRIAFSVLLLQDLAVVPVLFLVGVLAMRDGGGIGVQLLLALARALAAIALIYGAGRLLLRPLVRMVAATRSAEMFMAAILLVAIGSALLTHAAGLSMALGAFLAGLLLAETEFRHQIEVDIEPFKGLLLGLFFVSVGMGVDARLLLADPLRIAAALGVLLLGKAAIVWALCRGFGLANSIALEAGLLLAQAGEFAFVVLGLAGQHGLLATDSTQFLLIVASLSMLATPALALLGRRLAARAQAHEQAEVSRAAAAIEPLQKHFVIAGFGRVGQALARILDSEQLRYVALDLDAEEVARARAGGQSVHFGDASRLETLRRAHIGEARALVVTMDSVAAADHIVRAVREYAPGLPIYARARDSRHARRLLAHGASEVVPETVEAGLQLAARLLEGTGLPLDAVELRIQAERDAEIARLRA